MGRRVMKVNYEITVAQSAFSFCLIRNVPLFETYRESEINFEQDNKSGLDAATVKKKAMKEEEQKSAYRYC